MKRHGLIQVFTGDGKGKTTAAVGETLRAAGHGRKIFVTVFMKGDFPYGEWETLSKIPGVEVKSFGLPSFCNPQMVTDEEKAEAAKALEAARTAIMSGKYDLVVLDEVNVAVAFKLIERDALLSLLAEKPHSVEIILTGRYADPEVINKADLVTDMRKIKHPFDIGIPAREGVEY